VLFRSVSERKARVYYALFNLFTFSMVFATAVDNLGMLWVAIEMTTLVSAFLVGFYTTKKSVEAAWKYVIICSVGISLALLGTILLSWTVARQGGIASLNWSEIMGVAGKLDPSLVKLSFLFILVGYGTKAGLVPMHTWLPDAHSQALAPISALLSGVLLKTALYAMLRFTAILTRCAGSGYASALFILFGLLSLGVSAGFILVQRDLKRLLAYCSIEHVGIIVTGLGIGGALGTCGALFHVFNHAAAKSLLFFAAGDVVKRYRTSEMHLIRGAGRALPWAGGVLILGAFALAGSPPFSLFVSEMMILVAGFRTGAFAASALFIVLAAVIFGAMIHHLSGVVFGRKPEGIPAGDEPAGSRIAFCVLGAVVCAAWFAAPAWFGELLASAAGIVRGI
jgi:hydrogenase-4 component F